MSKPLNRAQVFCRRFGLQAPVFLAPMAGACPTQLSVEVANAGGAGACAALLMTPNEILNWAREFRAKSSGPFQINNWIPGAPPVRDPRRETEIRSFLSAWGPAVPENAGDLKTPDFALQTEAMLSAKPPILSSVMGLFSTVYIEQIKKAGISWFAAVTTVREAKLAEAAGADVIVAQGAEAGGHRASFDPSDAEVKMVGLLSLLPAVVDAVKIPVIATGGIADGRGVAAALILGASAVQIGTGFLRCPEAGISPAWADALSSTAPEDTRVSRVFSGRAGRSILTDYVKAATAIGAPEPAPYPVQRGLTALMRTEANKSGDAQRLQAWAGQSALLAQAAPASEVFDRLWKDAQELLG